MRKQTIGHRFEFFDFTRLKETFWRFTSKKCKRDKSFISFIYFLIALLALKMILSRRVTNILPCSLPETGHGMAVINFNEFSIAVNCIFVICHSPPPKHNMRIEELSQYKSSIFQQKEIITIAHLILSIMY